MTRKFAIMDVFTDTVTTGNQLGVVYDCEGLQSADMARIAREFNFPETIFISPSELPDCAARIRIFTPANELPFAGHPTVGAAIAVAQRDGLQAGQSMDLKLEEGVGPVSCRVRFGESDFFAEFDLPVIAEETMPHGSLADVAAALSIDEADIGFENHEQSGFFAGLPYDFVPVKDLEVAARVKVNMQHWHSAFGTHSHNSAYVYCRETADANNQFHARMFAPDAGIPEDPATGSAVASFAGVVAKFENLNDGQHTIRIEQGVEMDRASLISLSLEMKGGAIDSGSIGGNAVVFARGDLTR